MPGIQRGSWLPGAENGDLQLNIVSPVTAHVRRIATSRVDKRITSFVLATFHPLVRAGIPSRFSRRSAQSSQVIESESRTLDGVGATPPLRKTFPEMSTMTLQFLS